MTQRKRGPKPPDDCGPALPVARAGTAAENVGTATNTPTIHPNRPPCQPPGLANLADLAEAAQRQAAAAGLLAECCCLVGDPAGRAWWLRRRALHLAVVWAATHPQEVTAQ